MLRDWLAKACLCAVLLVVLHPYLGSQSFGLLCLPLALLLSWLLLALLLCLLLALLFCLLLALLFSVLFSVAPDLRVLLVVRVPVLLYIVLLTTCSLAVVPLLILSPLALWLWFLLCFFRLSLW